MIATEQGEYIRATGDTAKLIFTSSMDDSVDWNRPDVLLAGVSGVILGGSSEFDLHNEEEPEMRMVPARAILARTQPFIRFLLEDDFPTLGICFGHQLIGETFGGQVASDNEQSKVGSFEISLTEEGERDALFSTLSHTFMGQYGHHNSLSILPQNAVVLATGERCKFSALRYGNRIYTTQFHPELTAQDVYWKLEHSPGYLPEGDSLGEIIQPSPEASTLIPKWSELVASR
ncbi:MAG: type 1 glutamine amidotransferase [Ktedonobacteraceae bacterium]